MANQMTPDELRAAADECLAHVGQIAAELGINPETLDTPVVRCARATRRLADVIEYAERITGSNRAESTYVPERVRHADALATLAVARGDTTNHENRE